MENEKKSRKKMKQLEEETVKLKKEADEQREKAELEAKKVEEMVGEVDYKTKLLEERERNFEDNEIKARVVNVRWN